jgi:hypothetical protein
MNFGAATKKLALSTMLPALAAARTDFPFCVGIGS